LGGVTAELLADTVTLVLPATAPSRAALRRLRLWPLLDGYRGRPRAGSCGGGRGRAGLAGADAGRRPALRKSRSTR
jgi:hypothetical protein